jgi:hypothetical protein
MRNLIATALIATALATTGCGASAQQIVNDVVNVSTDVCTFISQNDPTAPTSVQVACKITGSASPVVVNLPWSAWQAMITGTTTTAARTAPKATR